MLFTYLKKLFIKKQPLESLAKKSSRVVLSSRDIKAIAGDNIMSTQLDLARAYSEMGKTSLAKKILKHVSEHGDAVQKAEALRLLRG